MIIAADISIAIPIALAALFVIAGSIYATQSYVSAYSQSSYETIRDYAISQQMAAVFGQQEWNSTQLADITQNMSTYYNVTVSTEPLDKISQCSTALCRLIDPNGISKLLVIK